MTIGDHHMFHLQGFLVSFSLEAPLAWDTHLEVMLIIQIITMIIMMIMMILGDFPGKEFGDLPSPLLKN